MTRIPILEVQSNPLDMHTESRKVNGKDIYILEICFLLAQVMPQVTYYQPKHLFDS